MCKYCEENKDIFSKTINKSATIENNKLKVEGYTGNIFNTIRFEIEIEINFCPMCRKEIKMILILPIKKKWFDMIVSGEKKEEYREIKPYWTKRLTKYLPMWETGIIKFRNGYGNNRPTILCKVILYKGQGKKEWGAEKRKRILCT